MSKGRQGSRRFRKTGVGVEKEHSRLSFQKRIFQFVFHVFYLIVKIQLIGLLKISLSCCPMKIISQMFKHAFFIFEEMQQSKAKTTLNRYIVKHFHEENRLTCC